MAGTEVVQRTPEQQLVARVRDPITVEQLQMALPPTVTVDRFVRVMTSAILTNPEIAKLDHTTVLRALVQSAAMGLIPDGKQAAITPRNGKAALVPMIQGYRDIAAEHGWTLRTAVVYANDEFDHVVEDGDEKILHRPVRPGADRGDLVAAYAIAKHRDGRKLMTVLHPEDIAHRRKSSSYDKVWNEHPAAMWEKSAGRDLFGQLGLADNDRIQQVLRADDVDADEATEALYGPTTPPARQIAAAPTEPPTGVTTAGDSSESQQAGGGANDPSPPPAPGTDEEPSLGDEQLPLNDTNDDERAAIEADAMAAAMFHPPNGKYTSKTLGEIAQETGADGWFANRLRVVADPEPYRHALWAFCRVYKPDVYQQVLAEKEAQAAA